MVIIGAVIVIVEMMVRIENDGDKKNSGRRDGDIESDGIKKEIVVRRDLK